MDEVLSGFRTHLGGVQAQYGVTPDLTTHAKALANGLPLASVSGREDLMLALAPTGPRRPQRHVLRPPAERAGRARYAGGVCASPVSSRASTPPATASIAICRTIFDRRWRPGAGAGHGRPLRHLLRPHEPVRTWSDALDHDHELNRQFAAGCIERGVYFHALHPAGPPGHAGFSLAHTDEDFAETLAVVETVARDMRAAA